MTTTIITSKLINKFYTKSEARYINAQGWAYVLYSMVPAGARYKKPGYGQNANVTEVTIFNKEQKDSLMKAVEKRAKQLRNKIGEGLDEWVKEQDAKEAAAKKAKREEDAIASMLKANDLGGIFTFINNNLRTGANTGKFTAKYDKSNGIDCIEENDKNGYSKSCPWTMVRRSFVIRIRKGWSIVKVGGLITFIKGNEIDENGMACEWVEQGKAIYEIYTVRGFLVRGEHIEAKNLEEAQRISAKHRADQLSRLIDERKKRAQRREQKANGTLMVTFQDSINSGNCRPGTMEFKRKYEAAIGHEAEEISINDLRKYSQQFGVVYYAERAISYAMRH